MIGAMEQIPIEQRDTPAQPEMPEAKRSLVSALGTDLSQVVTNVASGVATALALNRIQRGPDKPGDPPPPANDGTEKPQ